MIKMVAAMGLLANNGWGAKKGGKDLIQYLEIIM